MRAIHYATGRPISMHVEGGIIRAVDALESVDTDLPIVAPGLVDLQINGYAGYDINSLPLTDDTLGQMIRAMWREGVTSCFPTVITNAPDAITAAMRTIAVACERDPVTARGVAGVHLEGPFISPDDGARGAHSRAYVRAPDWDLFRRWQETAGGRIRILTMSPEWPGSADFIARCAQSGVTVSIGHTSATSEQIRDAVRAGARMSTHLGNAAHLMLPRHPNYLWEQLAQDELWTCVIADGFHLPDQVLKVVMKVKGERAMLVSDSVSLCGMTPGAYSTPVGGRVILTPEGRLHLAENEKLLAGSAQMLIKGVEHLIRSGLAGLSQAWDMASVGPAGFMGLPTAGGLTVGSPADLVVFRREGNFLRLEQTYKAGDLVSS
jgi:N-acetylglucosamine-6-phosphate deacetylase